MSRPVMLRVPSWESLFGFVSTHVKSAAPVIALVPDTVFITSLSPIFLVWWMSRMVMPR